jgi:hypothetical protein
MRPLPHHAVNFPDRRDKEGSGLDFPNREIARGNPQP